MAAIFNGRFTAMAFQFAVSHQEECIGFKNIDELTAFLEQWMKTSSE